MDNGGVRVDINIYNHEKVAEIGSLQERDYPCGGARVPPRGKRPEVQGVVEQAEQSLQQAGIQGVPGAVVQPVRLLQPSGQRYYQGLAFAIQPIDFPTWKAKIITKGLVDSVQKNYEELSAQEYDLDKAFNDIFSKDSKSIDEIVVVL